MKKNEHQEENERQQQEEGSSLPREFCEQLSNRFEKLMSAQMQDMAERTRHHLADQLHRQRRELQGAMGLQTDIVESENENPN